MRFIRVAVADSDTDSVTVDVIDIDSKSITHPITDNEPGCHSDAGAFSWSIRFSFIDIYSVSKADSITFTISIAVTVCCANTNAVGHASYTDVKSILNWCFMGRPAAMYCRASHAHRRRGRRRLGGHRRRGRPASSHICSVKQCYAHHSLRWGRWPRSAW